MKLMTALVAGGYLDSVGGNGGGVRLARTARTITVGEVVRYMERGFDLVECFADQFFGQFDIRQGKSHWHVQVIAMTCIHAAMANKNKAAPGDDKFEPRAASCHTPVFRYFTADQPSSRSMIRQAYLGRPSAALVKLAPAFQVLSPARRVFLLAQVAQRCRSSRHSSMTA